MVNILPERSEGENFGKSKLERCKKNVIFVTERANFGADIILSPMFERKTNWPERSEGESF